MNKIKYVLLPCLFLLSSTSVHAKQFNAVNVIPDEFNSIIPDSFYSDKPQKEIKHAAKEYIESGDYILVSDKAKKITEEKNTVCNDEGCQYDHYPLISNYQIGSIQKGFIEEARKNNVDEKTANEQLFSIMEKINNREEEESKSINDPALLINLVAKQENEVNEQLINTTEQCRAKNSQGEDIFYCVINQSHKYNNIFLNMKLKCYEDLLEKNIYKVSTISTFLGDCIYEQMSTEKFKRWSGYQFYQIGAVLYHNK